MSGNDVVLGLVALVLVVFSLVVSLLIPRRDPGFPGRNLRVFVVVAVLLVVAMLAAVELAGEAHEEEGGGGTEAAETQEGGQGGDGAGGGEGDPAAGSQVFAQAGCATCHALEDAGSTAEVGPNLDEALQGQDAAFVRESIVDPDAVVAEGFSPDLMPENYGEQLSEQELADLVAYLTQATGG